MISANEDEASEVLLETVGQSHLVRLVNPQISALDRTHLGAELRSFYAAVLTEEQPSQLLHLIARFADALSVQDAAASTKFQNDLIAALPGLRAFAMSLAVDGNRADDLVQETVMKAWTNQRRFEPGTNFMAWLCTILRNQFYTEIRKRKREVEDADGVMAAQMTTPAAQEHSADLRTIQVHLTKLPPTQREAIMLVAAQGMTYEGAAEIIGCQIGTVKNRVSRARAALIQQLRAQDGQLLA